MSEIEIAPPARANVVALPEQASSDNHLIELWLHGRPTSTRSAYEADVRSLVTHLRSPFRSTTIGDLQSWTATLERLRPSSQARKLAAIKSLFSYGRRIGYLQFDVAAPLLLPKVKDQLSERILGEAEVQRMLQLEPNARNNALLRFLYAGGLRISEVCDLCWRDLAGTKTGAVATVFGKGGKTRPVLVQPKLWRTLSALRAKAGSGEPVFRSERGGKLDRSAVHRIVKAAAARAGLSAAVSAHWLRHAHASHALDHGAPPHVLQGSLGHASLATTTRYVHVRPGDGSAKYLPE